MLQKLSDYKDEDLPDLNDNKSVSDTNRNFKFNLYWCNNLQISIDTSKHLKYDAKMKKNIINTKVNIMMTLANILGIQQRG